MQPEWRKIENRLIGKLRSGFPNAFLERVPERMNKSVRMHGGPGDSADGPKMCDGWQYDELEELSRLADLEHEEQYSTSYPDSPPRVGLDGELEKLSLGLPCLAERLRLVLDCFEPSAQPKLFLLGECRLSRAAANELCKVVDFGDLINRHQSGDWFSRVDITDDMRHCPVLPCFSADIRAAAAVEAGAGIVASNWPVPRAPDGGEYRGPYQAIHIITVLGDHTFIHATRQI
jgi:hypothetical protein